MAYTPPTTNEIRFLIKRYWQGHQNLSKRANGDDDMFLALKVLATQQLLRNLIRIGLPPSEAEAQALREVALAD